MLETGSGQRHVYYGALVARIHSISGTPHSPSRYSSNSGTPNVFTLLHICLRLLLKCQESESRDRRAIRDWSKICSESQAVGEPEWARAGFRVSVTEAGDVTMVENLITYLQGYVTQV